MAKRTKPFLNRMMVRPRLCRMTYVPYWQNLPALPQNSLRQLAHNFFVPRDHD